MRGAKTAEPIDMPFSMKTRVGPRNHVLDGVQIPQGDEASFGGCPVHSKALAIFAAAVFFLYFLCSLCFLFYLFTVLLVVTYLYTSSGIDRPVSRPEVVELEGEQTWL